MSQRQHIAFISHQCPNCRRFLEAVQASPSATKSIRIVDVDTLSPSQRGTLSVVPTLQTSTGQTLLGSKAFDYLKAYQEDTQLDCYNGAGGAFSNLVFSDYTTDDGKPEVTGFYGAFEPLP